MKGTKPNPIEKNPLNAQFIHSIIKDSHLICVSNRLPIQFDTTIKKSSGGLVAAFEDIVTDKKFTWVGWAGTFPQNKEQEEIISQKLKAFNYEPLFLSETQIKTYYDGFCNASLWPLLHYFPSNYRHEDHWFTTYKEVNQLFSDYICEKAPENSFIWVQDYHFFLLPALIKKNRPDLKVGFFLHTPFPSYEIFRIHPNRNELLTGILGADLIGFHTYHYLRHFRSAVLRICEIESDVFQIKNYPNETKCGVFPIGISWNHFHTTLTSDAFTDACKKLEQTYQHKKIILSVERLDYTKGILEKLNAIECFLNTYPEKIKEVKFVQILVPSRLQVNENQELVHKIETRISQINGKFGSINHIPINFIFRAIPHTELCALYASAHVALVTPLMDGMNLVAKEYIACKENRSGVLILSEFAGAAQELNNALIINPYDSKAFAQTIYQACQITEHEAKQMIQPMIASVKQKSSTFWSQQFLKELAMSQTHQKTIIQSKNDLHKLAPLFNEKKKKILIFDYDGSLREIEKTPEKASPTPEIKSLLTDLSKHDDCMVCINSGRSQDDLDAWFGDLNIHLIAEHGFFIKNIGQTWRKLNQQATFSWKPTIRSIMEDFTISTPGSLLEEKHVSLVWHYRLCDPDFGNWKAQELFTELHEMTSNYPVKIQKGNKKIVEVTSQEVNKGMAILDLIGQTHYDMIFCVGDDVTDESMFSLGLENLISVKIGEENTAASYHLPTPLALRQLLNEWINDG